MTLVPGRVFDAHTSDLDRWCRLHLGARVEEEVFRVGHLSTVIGVRLSSGRSVVVKIRGPTPRLAACAAVQRVLHLRGFPCPEPLVDNEAFGELVASAEVMVPGGEPFPASGRSPIPFAAALADLVRLAPSPNEVGPLEPAPPWTAPDHEAAELWPWPDDCDVDLNAVGGPGWIDEAGRAARDRLRLSAGELVVGHGDWYTANLGWAGDRLLAAYDWDSVIVGREPVVAGLAAAVFPATGGGTEATVEETEAFLAAYSSTRARAFSSDETELAWAAGLWNRSFDAKKQVVTEGKPRSLTESEALERRKRAGDT